MEVEEEDASPLAAGPDGTSARQQRGRRRLQAFMEPEEGPGWAPTGFPDHSIMPRAFGMILWGAVSEALFGSCWGPLGAFWGPLGALLGFSWAPLGRPPTVSYQEFLV